VTARVLIIRPGVAGKVMFVTAIVVIVAAIIVVITNLVGND
jgi:hypothetical protein